MLNHSERKKKGGEKQIAQLLMMLAFKQNK